MHFSIKRYEAVSGLHFSGDMSTLTIVNSRKNVDICGFFYISEEKRIIFFKEIEIEPEIKVEKCSDEEVLKYLSIPGNAVYKGKTIIDNDILTECNYDIKNYIKDIYKTSNIETNTFIISNNLGYFRITLIIDGEKEKSIQKEIRNSQLPIHPLQISDMAPLQVHNFHTSDTAIDNYS